MIANQHRLLAFDPIQMARHIIQQAEECEDGRRTAPAALRNTEHLIAALAKRLNETGHVLEVASGTGQHAAAFAQAFPHLDWQPSDVDADQRTSITAWHRTVGLPNLSAPIEIDVARPWPVAQKTVQAVLTINLLHLIPTPFVAQFFERAHDALDGAGRVIVYGPFKRGSDFISEGDRDFDASLRARDPSIGYKSVEEVIASAAGAGFVLLGSDDMPANNLLLTFTKQ